MITKRQKFTSLVLGVMMIAASGCGQQSVSAPHLGKASDKQALVTLNRLLASPFARVVLPQDMPSARIAQYYPATWTHAYANAQHNAAFEVSRAAPAWMKNGVSWFFPEARAWPLSNPNAYDTSVYGARSALPTITQFYGNATGVTVVKGIVYAESDDDFAYAINAKTGQLIWRSSPVGNHLMGDPVVLGNIVYISAGSVGFNFSAVQKYAAHQPAIRGEHVSFNGVYALNAQTGKLLWRYGTVGEAMATPVVKDGYIYFATGSGHIHCVNASTGQSVWDTFVGGIDNMSSLSVVNGKVYVSLSVPGWLYCLDAKTGQVIWKVTQPGVVNTGMGDVSPAVADHIVVMDAVADPKVIAGQKTVNTILFAVNALNGHVLWTTKMGRGPLPPAFKGGVPMIHDHVIYVGSPVNSVYQAYNLMNGRLLWTWHVPHAGPAGAGRGAPTYYQGALYVSTGPSIYALNPRTGQVLGHETLGGRFGIVNPVIVGGTIYLGNSWDWVLATPVSRVSCLIRI
ncbi:PQQ-like beta-propeller repeat protein [Sulfobacillus thermosulfidooxidans]|uniref:PQQ-like beta-propeller repeat protein n=1 Tax=Sulfobacillus thermosulfidooxidans TaxID=28034 RepID=UPI0006B55952|nr:PQQ-binding-like beta-propeller repeat protein [Sulfobacillus thermosulfidooxidans]